MTNDFEQSFPAGAAHAASEVDDYDGAAPEGFAISVAFGLMSAALVITLALAIVL